MMRVPPELGHYPSQTIEVEDVNCPQCGAVDRVVAFHMGRAIKAYCPTQAHFVKWLDKRTYDARFGIVTTTEPKRKTKYSVNESTRAQVLERDGHACVYCRYAQETRDAPLPAVEPPMIFASLEELTALNEGDGAVPTFTAESLQQIDHSERLEVDHVVPVSVQEDLAQEFKGELARLARSEWIVSACRRCNNGRKHVVPRPERLLAIYARHLFMREGDIERGLLDAELFLAAIRRVQNHYSDARIGMNGVSEDDSSHEPE